MTPFWGRGRAFNRTRQVGGRAHGRIHGPAWADGIVGNSHAVIRASLVPVILFRRRMQSVGDVLQGIRTNGFSTARWQALMLRSAAVCKQGLVSPVTTLEPWKDWHLPDLHGFNIWVFSALEELNLFVSWVVIAKREAALMSWKRWLVEDLTSRPLRWLRPDLVPLAPYLVCPPDQTPGGTGVLVQPILIDAQFRKSWMPFSGEKVGIR